MTPDPRGPSRQAVPTLAEVFDILRRYADGNCPRFHRNLHFGYEQHDGQKTRVAVPPCPCAPTEAAPPDRDADLNALERAVVAVVDDLASDETLTGEQVAAKAGYPYNGRLKDALARLVRSGRIRNLNPGYARQPSSDP